MALQTSGAISLNEIHIEAGGSSGTQASINDADIRQMINKSSGATASFSEYYGASSSLLSLNVTLTLSRQTLSNTSYDYKGNATTTPYGYQYNLVINNWNSLSFSTGQTSPQNLIGTFPSNATSVASTYNNFLGSTGGATYNGIRMVTSTSTNLQNVVSGRSSFFSVHHVGRADVHYDHFPYYNANSSMPTGWTKFNLTFSYGGTNYNWNWLRSNATFGNVDFTFGGAVSNAYMNIYTDTSGTTNFIGAGNSTAITISGATFTIT